MGTMQTDYEKEVRKFLLHLWSHGPLRLELANWTHVGKGKCGCVFEIRPTNTATPVFYLQPISWGHGCGLLSKNAPRNRARKDGTTRKRPSGNRKSL